MAASPSSFGTPRVDAALGGDTDTGSDSGDDDDFSTVTTGSTLIDTLTENLGAQGTISGGGEHYSLDEFSDDTTTEAGEPTETLTDSLSQTTMTATETTGATDTDTEDDEDWATETLGTSAVIEGGSDCFTVLTGDESDDDMTGSGTEDGSVHLSGDPDGAVTVSSPGSSTDLVDQTFGDVLVEGGAIASGSMTFEVENEDADDSGKGYGGTESYANELAERAERDWLVHDRHRDRH